MSECGLVCGRQTQTQSIQLIGKYVWLTHWGSSNEMMNEVFPQSHRGNIDQLCSDWNRTGCHGTENHGPRLTISPAVLGLGTFQRSRDPSRPESDAPPAGCHHSSSMENSWPSMLYCTERKILILLTLTECLLIVTFSCHIMLIDF